MSNGSSSAACKPASPSCAVTTPKPLRVNRMLKRRQSWGSSSTSKSRAPSPADGKGAGLLGGRRAGRGHTFSTPVIPCRPARQKRVDLIAQRLIGSLRTIGRPQRLILIQQARSFQWGSAASSGVGGISANAQASSAPAPWPATRPRPPRRGTQRRRGGRPRRGARPTWRPPARSSRTPERASSLMCSSIRATPRPETVPDRWGSASSSPTRRCG